VGNSGVKTIEKKVYIGSADVNPVTLAFTNIDSASAEPWIMDLLSRDSLVFDRLCNGVNFQRQREKLQGNIRGQGSVSADFDNRPALIATAEYLRLNLSGICFVFSSFMMFLYPTACEELAFLDEGKDFQPGIVLRHIMFEISSQISQCLGVTKHPIPVQVNLPPYTGLLQSMHNLTFEHLLISAPENEGAGIYYFLFPPHSKPFADYIKQWLLLHDPKIQMVDCAEDGVWANITTKKLSNHPRCMFIDSSMIGSIPKLPGFHHLLAVATFSFWSIGDGLTMSPALYDKPDDMGKISATRIFPLGGAIFLTPTLVLSEPKKALACLTWFHKKAERAVSGTWKIVTCHRFREYLYEIACEKALERKEIIAKATPDMPDMEPEAMRLGLDLSSCLDRFQLHATFDSLISTEKSPFTSHIWNSSPDGYKSPVVYAWNGIAQDDEEGLCDWFAAWAMTNMDRFRKFVVIGTDPKCASRIVRYKRIPITGINGKGLNEPGVEGNVGNPIVGLVLEKLKNTSDGAGPADAVDDFLNTLGEELSPTRVSARDKSLETDGPPSNTNTFNPPSRVSSNSDQTGKDSRWKPSGFTAVIPEPAPLAKEWITPAQNSSDPQHSIKVNTTFTNLPNSTTDMQTPQEHGTGEGTLPYEQSNFQSPNNLPTIPGSNEHMAEHDDLPTDDELIIALQAFIDATGDDHAASEYLLQTSGDTEEAIALYCRETGTRDRRCQGPRPETGSRPGSVPHEEEIAAAEPTSAQKTVVEMKFKPTTEWYTARKQRGKRWEHIEVLTYNAASSSLKIGK
jgi:hypothetical protein